jgi:hypothetical protein
MQQLVMTKLLKYLIVILVGVTVRFIKKYETA